MTHTEALKLALELKNSASGYWTEKEISIIEKLIDALAQPEQPDTDMAYTIALQRAIEWHCKGKTVPPDVAALCPHHAKKLNKALAQPEQEPDKYLYRVDVSRREDNTCTEYDHPIYFHSKADANNYCWTINQAPYPRNTIVVAKCVDIKIAPPPPQRTNERVQAFQEIAAKIESMPFNDDTMASLVLWIKDQA